MLNICNVLIANGKISKWLYFLKQLVQNEYYYIFVDVVTYSIECEAAYDSTSYVYLKNYFQNA